MEMPRFFMLLTLYIVYGLRFRHIYGVSCVTMVENPEIEVGPSLGAGLLNTVGNRRGRSGTVGQNLHIIFTWGLDSPKFDNIR